MEIDRKKHHAPTTLRVNSLMSDYYSSLIEEFLNRKCKEKKWGKLILIIK